MKQLLIIPLFLSLLIACGVPQDSEIVKTLENEMAEETVDIVE